MSDAMQGMLFGSLTDEQETGTDSTHDLRVCALNVNSPGPQRAQQLLDWLIGTNSNTLVLTELRPTDGCRLLISGLNAEGFDTHLPNGWTNSTHFTLLATRGFKTSPVTERFDPRAVAVDLAGQDGTIRLVGLYGPTNGMTAESSDRRRTFQKEFLGHLSAIMRRRLVLAGDLNVVEPGHQPHLDSFEEHDYAFYRALLATGLHDAYRTLHPTSIAHSWLSDRFGAQRLDHLFATQPTGTPAACDYDHGPRTAGMTDHAALLATITCTAWPGEGIVSRQEQAQAPMTASPGNGAFEDRIPRPTPPRHRS